MVHIGLSALQSFHSGLIENLNNGIGFCRQDISAVRPFDFNFKSSFETAAKALLCLHVYKGGKTTELLWEQASEPQWKLNLKPAPTRAVYSALVFANLRVVWRLRGVDPGCERGGRTPPKWCNYVVPARAGWEVQSRARRAGSDAPRINLFSFEQYTRPSVPFLPTPVGAMGISDRIRWLVHTSSW